MFTGCIPTKQEGTRGPPASSPQLTHALLRLLPQTGRCAVHWNHTHHSTVLAARDDVIFSLIYGLRIPGESGVSLRHLGLVFQLVEVAAFMGQLRCFSFKYYSVDLPCVTTNYPMTVTLKCRSTMGYARGPAGFRTDPFLL